MREDLAAKQVELVVELADTPIALVIDAWCEMRLRPCSGLALTQQIAKDHGGDLAVESRVTVRRLDPPRLATCDRASGEGS